MPTEAPSRAELEQALAAASAKLNDGIHTEAEMYDRLRSANCGGKTAVSNWARECPLASWYAAELKPILAPDMAVSVSFETVHVLDTGFPREYAMGDLTQLETLVRQNIDFGKVPGLSRDK